MRKFLSLGLSLVLALTWLGAGNVTPALAASFTVNSTADLPDASPGDGRCQAVVPTPTPTPTAAPPPSADVCTLRAAIMEANALGGDDTISLPASVFQLTIPGAGEDASATGDLDINSNIVISGSSAATTFVDGNGVTTLDRVFHIINGTVTLSNLTIENGNPGPGADGGGILLSNGALTLNSVVLTGNSAGSGAGLLQNGGSLSIRFSTITTNTAEATGFGGGVNIARGTAVIANSTLDHNQAGTGGGLAVASGAQARLNNSTVANNTANGTSVTSGGGGLFAAGALQLNSVTVAKNDATDPTTSGGGILQLGGSVSLRNTLIADNTNAGPASPDCSGTLSTQGYNLLEDNRGCNGIVNNVNGDIVVSSIVPIPVFSLPDLANIGGPTRTIAIQSAAGGGAGSLAVDAGNPVGCGDGSSAFANDQRGPGFSRNQNLRCDIGAFEYIYQTAVDTATTIPTNTLTPSITFTPSATPTNTATGTAVPTSTNTATGTATRTATVTATQAPKVPLFTSAPPTVDVSAGQTQRVVSTQIAALTLAAAVPTATPNVALTQTVFAAANASPTLTATASASPSAAPTLMMPADDAVLAGSQSVGRSGGRFVCGLWVLEAPAGAVPEGSQFQCATVPADDASVPALPSTVRGFWQTTEIKILASNGAAIESFTQPLKLCGYYSDAYKTTVGGDAKNFTIYNASVGGDWQALATTPDAVTQRVCAAVDRFALFRLAGQPVAAAATGGVAAWLSSGLAMYAIIGCVLLFLVVLIIVVIVVLRRRKPQED
jgi:CSLREA domain-containing protein